MRFWDASAIVPLCLDQPLSSRAAALHQEQSGKVVWWGTPVECASAFARLRRDGGLTPADEAAALALLRQLQASWYEVVPGEAIRDHAQRLLRIHPLRATDALQLAAALEWAGPGVTGEIITFDERLKTAAQLEGFATP